MTLLTALRRLVESGMTQREIARELGCTQSNISQLIHGKIGGTRPSAKIVAGIERLLYSRIAAAKTDLPPPEIPSDLQYAAATLKGLSGKFADEDAIAWFLHLPPKKREELFEIHDCITTGICIEELNRIKSVTKGDPKNDFANE